MTLPRYTRVIARAQAAAESAAGAQVADELRLNWDQRCRSRARRTIARGPRAGTEVVLDLPRGTVLRDGDLLVAEPQASAEDPGRDGPPQPVRVVAAVQQLMHVEADSPLALACIGYHLGNRHFPVQFGQDAGKKLWLRLPIDHVLEAMVDGLGGRVTVVNAPFDPEHGAYGHGHGHGHGHDHGSDHGHDDDGHRHGDTHHAPRIHDFTPPQ